MDLFDLWLDALCLELATDAELDRLSRIARIDRIRYGYDFGHRFTTYERERPKTLQPNEIRSLRSRLGRAWTTDRRRELLELALEGRFIYCRDAKKLVNTFSSLSKKTTAAVWIAERGLLLDPENVDRLTDAVRQDGFWSTSGERRKGRDAAREIRAAVC